MTTEEAVTAAQVIDRVYLAPVSLYARQSEGGINNPHLRWMVEQMPGMAEDKAMRWLGYIQGVLVAQGRSTLSEMKTLNQQAALTSQDRGEK